MPAGASGARRVVRRDGERNPVLRGRPRVGRERFTLKDLARGFGVHVQPFHTRRVIFAVRVRIGDVDVQPSHEFEPDWNVRVQPSHALAFGGHARRTEENERVQPLHAPEQREV